MAELGRASGRARRSRRDRAWADTFLQSEEFKTAVRSSGNLMAQVEAIRLAQEARRERLDTREAELEAREKAVASAESSLAGWQEWAGLAKRQYEARQAEIGELERRRDEVRELVEREGREAGFALVQGDGNVAWMEEGTGGRSRRSHGCVESPCPSPVAIVEVSSGYARENSKRARIKLAKLLELADEVQADYIRGAAGEVDAGRLVELLERLPDTGDRVTRFMGELRRELGG